MSASSRKTALIAGGGIAGLNAAVLLDELGYHVTLLEKRPILGGRTYSFTDRKTGLEVDNGQHLLVGAYHQTLRFLERVGAKSKTAALTPTNVPLFNDRSAKARFCIGGGRPPLGLMAAVARYPHFSWRDMAGFLKLGLELLRLKSGAKALPADRTVSQWLRQNGQTENALKNFWEILTLATLNDSPDVASADALATVLLKSYFAGRTDGRLVFPKAGLSDLFVKPALAYLEARGHEVKAGLGVKMARILNGRVQEFVLTDGTARKADLFVAAMPPHRLLGILPSPFVEARPELKAVKDFVYAPIVSINLFFDRPVMDDAFAGSAATRVHWFFNRDAGRATGRTALSLDTGRLSHVIGVVSGAYDLANKPKDGLVDIATSELSRLYPAARRAKLVHASVNVERQATLSCRVGVNVQRPRQRLLDNFYIIGDWTDTGLPPTIESAAVSARMMADALMH